MYFVIFVEKDLVISCSKLFTRDGWKLWCEVILLRNKVKGEITEGYLYQTLSTYNFIHPSNTGANQSKSEGTDLNYRVPKSKLKVSILAKTIL